MTDRTYDPPENTVKPGFEIEPIRTPEPPPHDPMDAHWQALIAERDNLKKACTAFECAADAYRAERDKLKEELARVRSPYYKLVERVSELERALKSIREHCICGAALSRTSEELPARDREVGRRNSWTRAPK
jgi:predicted nuclease with TOPRIM domain